MLSVGQKIIWTEGGSQKFVAKIIGPPSWAVIDPFYKRHSYVWIKLDYDGTELGIPEENFKYELLISKKRNLPNWW